MNSLISVINQSILLQQGDIRTIMTKEIWSKSGESNISTRKYAAVLGLSLTWAIFLVAAGSRISSDWNYGLGLVLFTFIFSIAGIVIYSNSKDPGTSFLGVSILSFFMGLSIGPVLAYYNADLITNALILTVAVTMGMAILGVLLPDVISKFAGVLFVGLIILMVGYFSATILALFGVSASYAALDWFSLVIFSLYIWYDWSRAMKLPKTVKNAIDASGALIVDIVNLFMTLLRRVARSQSNS